MAFSDSVIVAAIGLVTALTTAGLVLLIMTIRTDRKVDGQDA